MLHKDYDCKGSGHESQGAMSLVVGQPPAGKNVSTEAEDIVGIRHQATTGKDTADWEGSTYCSELHSVWISDSAIVTCGHDLQVVNKSNYQFKHRL
jgi:hypothetical protein